MIKKTICFNNRAVLSCRLDQLKIKIFDPATGKDQELTRPIEDIGVIIVESEQVSLTSALITKLMENNVALIFCDKKHMPSGLVLPLEGNTMLSERFSSLINSSIPLKKQLWQQTVSLKIRN